MKFKGLPQSAQQQLIQDRGRIVDFMRTPGIGPSTSRTGTIPKTKHVARKIFGGGTIKIPSDSFTHDFIPYNVKNNVIYECFDDPNELCDRLRLLVSSRMAGNTNHTQEINSII